MSLGTLVETLPEDVAEHLAAAVTQFPQKVIWRHTGRRRSTLVNNILLLDWLHQNVLLGHRDQSVCGPTEAPTDFKRPSTVEFPSWAFL
ncbi:hypothetical protein VZT92_018644 [Zoarces viviparus]|uniref:Uncharacterized protein n=1 Tax=Zoarces viviparus TaxID=48416 RepID=A0AAW1EJ64_ZOAVI